MTPVVFTQLLALLGASIGVIYLFHRLNLPSVLGYLSVGIFAGLMLDYTSLLQLQDMQVIAKFGVVFLLFSIGLQLPIRRLLAMKSAVFLLGGLQVVITTVVAWGIAALTPLSPTAAFVVGAAASLSSTAMISKTLADSKELNTPLGRSAFGAIIFQDMMVAPLLIIITALAETTGNESLWFNISLEMVKGAATLIFLYFIGHWILSPLFLAISKTRSSELFMLTALFTALAAANFTEMMGLSKELGAFLAGVLLSGTPYHHQVEADIRPFKDSLLGFFFISVGMMVDIHLLPIVWQQVTLVAFGLVVIKLILTTLICRGLRMHNRRDSLRIGILLAQGGEFSFVLIALASQIQILSPIDDQVLLMSFIFSMIISLLLIYSYDKLKKHFPEPNLATSSLTNNYNEELNGHVIICGFGRTGQQIAGILASEGFQYLAIDSDPTRVNQAALAGENIIYGDASRESILEATKLNLAKALVITFANKDAAAAITQHAHKTSPKINILVRTHNDDDYKKFMAIGATEVITRTSESSLLLGSHLLLLLGVPRYRVMRWSFDTHQNRYSMLRGFFQAGDSLHHHEDNDNERENLQSFFLPARSFAIGKTIAELNLNQYEVIITALRRNGIRSEDPPVETKLKENDIIVLYGRSNAIENAEVKLITGN
ncbi:K(+)/H(+) antiporter [Piscirickettsia salmonis]|uniref:Sodium:proton exchanger n=1 Tax=Piscirickettsia salmonis TaxID=1238 RepID=A0A1L6TCD1_PISSA|nr:cation:proton antiporter [Piscirickettsia salmonis]AKP74156.1 sodium:proton exchanger [Piscirickettsia salmonis LF-89 = ATCC VR-1361]ALB23034.1 sodium:proton exchanger [Piscirickettsia salmonis]ALY02971.1 sodium:proton exchanger [Piscirickettsia salmonis]AMA42527.1 sodium:proton exchanger [Piscirickettsia salmonis]AOS34997.1 sodium:proton exchanger [Piscirickettsia salmonis]